MKTLTAYKCTVNYQSILTPSILYLSPIVVAEIFAGAFKKEYADIEAFFSLCTVLTLDMKTAKQAGLLTNAYRKAHSGISLEDYMFAATALQLNCPLWTQNVKH